MIFIGIDPGKTGSIVALNRRGKVLLSMRLKNADEGDIVDALKSFDPASCVVFIEAVGPMPRQGALPAFYFGASYGFLLGVLATLDLKRGRVAPATWKKEFGILLAAPKGRKKGKQEDGRVIMSNERSTKKAASRAKVKELFPSTKITNHNADGLLIAEFCRRKCNHD